MRSWAFLLCVWFTSTRINDNYIHVSGNIYYTELASHECNSVSNHRQLDWLFNSLFGLTRTAVSLAFCEGNSLWPVDFAHKVTGDPLHSRAACTQPCNVNTHTRAHCSPGARLCEQWGHGCVNNGARLCASARLCRGSPVKVPVMRKTCAWLEAILIITGDPLHNLTELHTT